MEFLSHADSQTSIELGNEVVEEEKNQAAGSPRSDAMHSRRARRVNRFKQMTQSWVD
jgi:hypothetical protein